MKMVTTRWNPLPRIDTPKEAMGKMFTKIFNSLTPPKRKAVKNGIELVQSVKDVKIKKNEEMCSYDVTSLYPSVLISFSMVYCGSTHCCAYWLEFDSWLSGSTTLATPEV